MGTLDSNLTDESSITNATLWRPGAGPRPVARAALDSEGDGVLWLELDPSADRSEVMATLAPLCRGLDGLMLADLLTPDRLPDGRSYANGTIRLVSLSGMRLDAVSEADQLSHELIVDPVELLASRDWLISCRQPSWRVDGEGRVSAGEGIVDWQELRANVTRRWNDGSWETAGDLGILVMHQLALTYSACERALSSLLEDWELRLYEGTAVFAEQLADHRAALRELWQLRAQMRDWIAPLNRVGLSVDADRAWLPCGDLHEATAVDDRIDRVLRNLAELGVALRSSFHLLHLEEQERERERREEVQRRIEVIAAIFLIPTFIVGVYGANTWLPGQGREWGFAAMLLITVTLTVAGVILLRRWQVENQSAASRALAAPPRER
jgi:hypothetical protein